jgi:competence ComEA-like helix-hairpin-helix protein
VSGFFIYQGKKMTQLLKYSSFNSISGFIKTCLFACFLAAFSLGSYFAFASPVNVNTATQSELESIKGIGPAKAKTIIAERLDGGHFQDANDLQKRVRGIGMKSVEKMVDNGLTIEAPSAYREPNGRSNKDTAGAARRGSRNQGSTRNQSDRSSAARRN